MNEPVTPANIPACISTPPAETATLTRDQWLARCAARFREVAAVEEALAREMAESQLENLKEDLSENPENAADDEMSYWTPD